MRRIEDFSSQVYLINTGWTGGSGAPGGTGSRFPIPVTRAVVAAAQSGALKNAPTSHLDILNLDFPTEIPGVDSRYVDPRASWGDDAAYDKQAQALANLFQNNSFGQWNRQKQSRPASSSPKFSTAMNRKST